MNGGISLCTEPIGFTAETWSFLVFYQAPRQVRRRKLKVKELLLLMNIDKSGRVEARMDEFMEAEFNKLDKDGKGDLDRKELLQSKLSVPKPRQ